ncbi:phage baseplate assembly protein V [Corallococcus sp. 4LFB]|uniref:phage baseplate assembly protein V n=1 Tax=Corallococcus sp. 4LFB TaxID=3383249 RepID=UPI00397514B9
MRLEAGPPEVPEAWARRAYGITVGIVTNNKDPERRGRVRVRFPRFSDQDESAWAPVLSPMAGANRGLLLLPEKDDHVLVAFDNGDLHFPYVIGCLFAACPLPVSDTACQPPGPQGTEQDVKVLRSRSGHTLTLDDTQGRERITLCDGKGKVRMTFDSKSGALTLHADGDVTMEAGGRLTLSGASVTLEDKGPGRISIQGGKVDINRGALEVV